MPKQKKEQNQKPTTKKGKKIMEQRKGSEVEGSKGGIFLRGRSSTNTTMALLKFFYKLMPVENKLLWTKRHEVDDAFNNPSEITRRCEKNDVSFQMLVTHQKKKPQAILFARLFDFEVMDQYEFEVMTQLDEHSFKKLQITPHMKPMLVFEGAEFNNEKLYQNLKNFMTDFFKGDPSRNQVSINNLDFCLVFSIKNLADNILVMNSQEIIKTEENNELKLNLAPIHKPIEIKLKRHKDIDERMWKEAMRKPVPITKQIIEEFKGEKVKSVKRKNMKRTSTGLEGRVFVNQQDIKTKKDKFRRDGSKISKKSDIIRNDLKRKRDKISNE